MKLHSIFFLLAVLTVAGCQQILGIDEATIIADGGTLPSDGAAIIVDAAVDAANAFTVGGTVAGLATGDEIELTLNDGETITLSNNEAFSFTSELGGGDAYSVVISAQSVLADCSISKGSGTISAADVADVSVACVPATFSVGATVLGLVGGDQIDLTLNDNETTTVDVNGLVTFATLLNDGDAYAVTITAQSAVVECSVVSGSGTISAVSVSDIVINCVPGTFVVGGSVSGLAAGDEVELTLNSTETITVSTNVGFNFTTLLSDGNAYSVAITDQSATVDCSLTNASGTIAAANITDVTVSCVPATFVVGGTVSGLAASEQVDLSLNGTETLAITANGGFSFLTELEGGATYEVTVLNQPTGQDCTVVNASGTIAVADVSDVEVTCTDTIAPELTSLVLSTFAPLDPTFDPAQTSYQVDVGVLESEITLTPISLDPAATILVNSVSVASGAASGAIALNLGANVITIEVTASGGTQTYQLNVTRGSNVLAQVAYIKASNPEASDLFGFKVALSGDTLVVGAFLEDSNSIADQGNNSATSSGAVYVFRRTGNTWAQEAYLKASNISPSDNFGGSVAISGDTIVVAAPEERSSDGDPENNDAFSAGAAYVFQRTGSTWSEQAYLKASTIEGGDGFGFSVAISGDTVAVSARLEDSNSIGDQTDNSAGNSGAVYVFQRTGSVWSQEAYLKASNLDANDFFGQRIALSGDTLAVGATGESSNGDTSDNSVGSSGAVYVFQRSGSTWSEQAYLKASNAAASDRLGGGLALSGDTLAVGADGEDSNGDPANNSVSGSGAIYVFRRTGTTWAEEDYLKASNPGANDSFGTNISLSGDTLAVGVNFEDSNGDPTDNSVSNSGAAYVFRRTGSTWAQEDYLKASNAEAGDGFGHSVAISGDTLVVGAGEEDSNATGVDGDQADNSISSAGAVYVLQ